MLPNTNPFGGDLASETNLWGGGGRESSKVTVDIVLPWLQDKIHKVKKIFVDFLLSSEVPYLKMAWISSVYFTLKLTNDVK